MSLSMAHPVLADVVERLDQLGPQDGCVVVLDADKPGADQPVECSLVGDQPPRLGDGHRLWLLRRPRACDRRLQPEDLAQVLALLPGAEHLVHMGDVVAAVQHRGDQPQPREMRVVEQRDAAHPQRRMQQAAIAVHANVAGRRSRQSREIVDPVLPGGRDALGVADRRVEEL